MKFLEALLENATATSDENLPYAEVISRIESLNEGLREFWSQSHGWAPADAAELMSKSRLDWQVSLSRSLKHWAVEPPDSIEDGDLILGWANLGSLIEGTVKLFLAVYYEDYKNDLDTLKQTPAWKKGKLLDPDGLMLEALIQYVSKAELFPSDELALLKLVQARRNAIHAFKDRPIGTGSEFHAAVREYLGMLRSTANRLPYPDEMYAPQEY